MQHAHLTISASVTGDAPLVKSGDGTLVLTVGSTGATGLEEFTVETSRPYEAQVLRFREGRLIAIDYLTVQGIGGDFTLERRLVDVAEAEPEDAVSPAP